MYNTQGEKEEFLWTEKWKQHNMDVEDHLGMPPMGIVSHDSKEADVLPKQIKPDVCIIATWSTMAELKETFSVCAQNGLNAISTCE